MKNRYGRLFGYQVNLEWDCWTWGLTRRPEGSRCLELGPLSIDSIGRGRGRWTDWKRLAVNMRNEVLVHNPSLERASPGIQAAMTAIDVAYRALDEARGRGSK